MDKESFKQNCEKMMPPRLANKEGLINDLWNESRKLCRDVKTKCPQNQQESMMALVGEKIYKCASLGFAPNTPDGFATMYVSNEWTDRNGRYHAPEVVFTIDYKGQVRLCARHGWTFLPAILVYEGDKFEVVIRNGNYTINHVPKFASKKVSGGYCIATNGDKTVTEYMSADEINAAKAKSRSNNSGPWVDFFEDMARKTIVKKCAKEITTLGYIPDMILDVEIDPEDDVVIADTPKRYADPVTEPVTEPVTVPKVKIVEPEVQETADPEPDFPEPDFPDDDIPAEEPPVTQKGDENLSNGAKMFKIWAKSAGLTPEEKEKLWNEDIPAALSVGTKEEAKYFFNQMTEDQAQEIIDDFEITRNLS